MMEHEMGGSPSTRLSQTISNNIPFTQNVSNPYLPTPPQKRTNRRDNGTILMKHMNVLSQHRNNQHRICLNQNFGIPPLPANLKTTQNRQEFCLQNFRNTAVARVPAQPGATPIAD